MIAGAAKTRYPMPLTSMTSESAVIAPTTPSTDAITGYLQPMRDCESHFAAQRRSQCALLAAWMVRRDKQSRLRVEGRCRADRDRLRPRNRDSQSRAPQNRTQDA